MSDDFYTIDYTDEEKEQPQYDPLSFFGGEAIGRSAILSGKKKEKSQYKEYFQQPKPTKAQSELVPLVEDSKYKTDYSWWRKEDDYTKWLASQNMKPEALDDFTGNKLYTKFIQYKAENPEGFRKFSKETMEDIGSIIQGVSDTIQKVPGMSKVVKPMGSILQFIGNVLDTPRNVLAGAFTALSSGHGEDVLDNMWQALKYSIGSGLSGGNEGPEEGQYFSWTDGAYQSLIDKARQGMTEAEYKEYSNSDSFRQNKRLFQAGGMLLDMVLDPAWLVGAFEVKAFKEMKGLSLGKDFLDNLITQTARTGSQFVKEGVVPTLSAVQRQLLPMERFAKVADEVNYFTQKSKKAIGIIAENESFVRGLGKTSKELLSMPTIDAVEWLSDKFKGFSKGETKKWEYGLRMKMPFTEGQLNVRLSPSLQPLVDAVKTKIGGAERGFISITGRASERAHAKVGILSEIPEQIKGWAKDFDNSLRDFAEKGDAAAQALLKDPDKFHEFTSLLLQADKNNPLSIFWNDKLKEQLGMTTFEEFNKPLFEKMLTTKGVQEARETVHDILKKTYDAYTKEENQFYMAAKSMGLSDAEGFERIYGRKQIKGEKYFYRETTDELKEFIQSNKKYPKITGLEDFHYAGVATDPSRKMYVPRSLGNDYINSVLFKTDESMQTYLAAVKNDPKEAMLLWQEAFHKLAEEQPIVFKEFTQLSDVPKPGGGYFKYDELNLEEFAGKTPKYLLSQGNETLINHLSQQGMMIRGYNGRIYKGGIESLYTKLVNDQMGIERLEGLFDLFREGQKEGWLLPKKTFANVDTLDPTFKLIDKGVFQGFYIKDFLEKPMTQAMKGIYGVMDAKVVHGPMVQSGLDVLEKMNKWWKVNIYMKNPAAQARNFVTNRMMMLGWGISPSNILSKNASDGRKVFKYFRAAEDYQEAVKFGYKNVTDLKNKWKQLGMEEVFLDGKNIKVAEANELLMRKNIQSLGFTQNMLEEIYRATDPDAAKKLDMVINGKKDSVLKKYNIAGTEDILAKGGRKAGNFIENALGRNEAFFTLVNNKGLSIEDAAAQVNQIMVDYARISQTEASFRKYLMPFYTWTSRMIPNMLVKAIEQPVYYTKLVQFKNNMYNMLELDRNFAPAGEQVMEGMPIIAPHDIPSFVKGKPLNEISTQYISGEGWLPQAVVNLFQPAPLSSLWDPEGQTTMEKVDNFFPVRTGKNMITGLVEYITGSATPVLKIPFETASGYSFQFKRALETYPDQTVRFLGMNLSPRMANILRSTSAVLREADDIINTWDKNGLTGQPKFTVYDLVFKNLIGYRPYERNEIREVTGALGKLKEIYQGNLSDARKMEFNPSARKEHAYKALMALNGIKMLEFYRDFVTEVRDKEMTARGLTERIEKIDKSLQNPKISKKNRFKYMIERNDLAEKIRGFIEDTADL